MSISQHFCDAHRWAQAHFGGVQLGNVRRSRRVCTLAAGWARQPGASIPRLGAGSAYASKAAYQLLGGASATPDTLQGPHRALVQQELQAVGTYLLLEDTTQLRWAPATARRAGLGPVGAGTSGEQGVLLHSLVAAQWPADNPSAGCARAPITAAGPTRPAILCAPGTLSRRESAPPRRYSAPAGAGPRVRFVGSEPTGRWLPTRRRALGGGRRPRGGHLRAPAPVPAAGAGLCGAPRRTGAW